MNNEVALLAASTWASSNASMGCDPAEFGEKVAAAYTAALGGTKAGTAGPGPSATPKPMRISGIAKAVRKFGSPAKLAEAIGCGVVRQHVEHWLKAKRVPAEKAPDVERATGIPCEQLCPDVNWAVLRGVPAPTAKEVATQEEAAA